MRFLNSLMERLNGTMIEPIAFGPFEASWFHYVVLLSLLLITILLIQGLKDADHQKIRVYIFFFAITLISFEIYKQLLYAYNSDWTYRWSQFPFQICSTPMYVALAAALVRKGKLQTILISYLATYSLLAGIQVTVVVPSFVYGTNTGLNIQTMLHHGLMGAFGIGLLVNHRHTVREGFRGAVILYLLFFLTAISLNHTHNTWIQDGSFNMFFINPVYGSHADILLNIQQSIPQSVFLLLHFSVFTLVSYLLMKLATQIIPTLASRPKIIQQTLPGKAQN